MKGNSNSNYIYLYLYLTCYLRLTKIDVSESRFMINGMILILIL